MNILILSAGTRDKVVQYFNKELNGEGKVIATDCSNLAPAVYEADEFRLVTRIDVPGYIDRVAVFSLIDPELSMIAEREQDFRDIGVTPVISPYDLVETCFNKVKMAKLFAEYGLKTGKVYTSIDNFKSAVDCGEISYPIFVKPICGSASLHINMVSSDEELKGLFAMYDDLMIQEYMRGQEYGADVKFAVAAVFLTDILCIITLPSSARRNVFTFSSVLTPFTMAIILSIVISARTQACSPAILNGTAIETIICPVAKSV